MVKNFEIFLRIKLQSHSYTFIQKRTDPVHLIHSDETHFPKGLQQLYHHMAGSVPFRLQHHHYSLKNTMIQHIMCEVCCTEVKY